MGRLRNDLDKQDHDWIMKNSRQNMEKETLSVATFNKHNAHTRRLRRIGYVTDHVVALFEETVIVWTEEGKKYAELVHSFDNL